MIYLLIFLAKTLENILTTIRIIVLSNQKKFIGAILNFFIAIIWIFATISVLRNFTTEPFKIIAFALGCFVGSYLGCVIEEKIALGDNMITCITSDDSPIMEKLRHLDYQVTAIDGYGWNNKEKVLLIMTSRKKRYRLARLIKMMDKSATIITETASYYDSK